MEPAKFTFETVFDQSQSLHGDRSQTTVVSKEDIIEARQEGYNEGFEAGKNDEELIRSRELNAQLEHISSALATLVRTLDQIEQKTSEEARAFALMITRKLVLNLKKIHPTAGIEALIEDSLKQLSHAPHIVIRLNEKHLKSLEEKITNISTQLGCQDKVIIVSDPDIEEPDCRIEWADGGIERNTAQIEAQIDEIIGRYFPLAASAESGKASDTSQEVKETEDE